MKYIIGIAIYPKIEVLLAYANVIEKDGYTKYTFSKDKIFININWNFYDDQEGWWYEEIDSTVTEVSTLEDAQRELVIGILE